MGDEPSIKADVEQIMGEVGRENQINADRKSSAAFENIHIRGEKSVEQGEQINWAVLEEFLTYINQELKQVKQEIAELKQKSADSEAANAHKIASLKQYIDEINVKQGTIKCLEANFAEQNGALKVFVIDRTNQLENMIKQLDTSNMEVIDNLRSAAMEMTRQLQTAQQHIDRLVQAEEALNGKLDKLETKVGYLDRQSDTFSVTAAKAILTYNRQMGLPDSEQLVRPQKPQKDDGNLYKALDYFKFQNDFRGTRSTIMERQEMYLSYFENASAPVLDIGCGRGEFLCLLKNHGIPAFGVDLYPEYVAEGELNGLDVRQGDGIAFLKETDSQFGGIFACQVIEHISFDQLQELCALAYEKLLPGAYLALETPNPTCLSMFATSFYMDPTHIKPVHPLLLEYLLRKIGFKEVKIIYTSASKAGFPLPKIDSNEIKNLEEVNAAIGRVSEFLYGSLDYAVIAKK